MTILARILASLSIYDRGAIGTLLYVALCVAVAMLGKRYGLWRDE